MCGISFFPFSDFCYKQAPLQECTEEEYNEMVLKIPDVNWESLKNYEEGDNTTGAQEFACTGAKSCDIVL